MSKSVKRVRAAAQALGLDITVQEMPDSTRTAVEAAAACGVTLDQIVKSLIFTAGDGLHLFLVAGGNTLDLDTAARAVGSDLTRADADQVRRETGFAIGGVAPIGHLAPVPVWFDPRLLDFETVVAVAGTPRHVFSVAPQILRDATGANLLPR